MNRILVTYATLSGTTADVAQAVGAEIAKSGVQVDILPLTAVQGLDAYDGVVLGAPMIAGWHRDALSFLRKHKRECSRLPFALFATAMSLTQTSTASVDGVPICIDDALPKPPKRPDHLSFRERYARVENYARPMLNAARPSRPVSVAFFGGRLEYGRLPWWAVVFAMFIIQAPAGDKHNWRFIRDWAAQLMPMFDPASALPAQRMSVNG